MSDPDTLKKEERPTMTVGDLKKWLANWGDDKDDCEIRLILNHKNVQVEDALQSAAVVTRFVNGVELPPKKIMLIGQSFDDDEP